MYQEVCRETIKKGIMTLTLPSMLIGGAIFAVWNIDQLQVAA
jgi:hypothetical protein